MTLDVLSPPVRVDRDAETSLYEKSVVVLRGDRRRWIVEGPNAVAVLDGLLTNDIARLKPGDGCYAAALTPKGKVVADLRIFARNGAFLVDATAAAGDGWTAILRKYVNPRLAKWREITAETTCVTLAGATTAQSLAALTQAAIGPTATYAHFEIDLQGLQLLVIASPELDVPACDLIAFAGDSRLAQIAARAGIETASLEVVDCSRIAAGRPVWGRDMDESTLAQEANLDSLDAVSYDKGCYTGQETVARLHFRGHVNRYLRRVRSSSAAELHSGAELFDESGKNVGDVRSSAISHRHGGVAIAMVRREVPGGATLTARWNDRSAAIKLQPE